MSGAYVVVRHRKSWSGTVTVDTFGPYLEDVATRARARLMLIEARKPVLVRGTVHLCQLQGRVTE